MKNISEKMYKVNSSGHIAMVEQFDPSTMVIKTLTPDMKLSQGQIDMLNDAGNYPITYEDDCPELTPEMVEAFKKAANARDKRKRENQLVG